VKELEGRIAVVTGAASGIGLAVTEAFLDQGMKVVMADLDATGLQREAERLAEGGRVVHPVPTDVTRPEAMAALAQATTDRFGALHVAVNNAGIVRGGYAWELPLEDWHAVIDVDLWGVIHGIHYLVPLILDTGQEGHVVNVASMASVVAIGRLGAYTVAKHGVLGLTDVLRADLEDRGIPVGASVVMPGMIRTAMNPIGTVEPSTVAANVIDAIRHDRAYVFTDDHSTSDVDDRLTAIMAARSDVLP
jgi:NAD(P)-dependent dehydrogenase (short-subunit alcohol dehydrogenase family)